MSTTSTALPRFDLFTLQLVLAIEASGSVARAADTMHITASAVSKRILELEGQLGTTILERHSQGARLNSAGNALARRARAILQELHALQDDMAGFTEGAAGSVRVVSNTSGFACGLADQLVEFAQQYPKIEVSVSEATSPAVVQAVSEGWADLGIASADTRHGGLSAMPYRSTPLVLAVPKKHPLASRGTIRYAESLAYPHVGRALDSALGPLSSGSIVDPIASKRVLSSLVTSFSAVLSWVKAGAGVAVLPLAPSELLMPPDIVFVPLKDSWAHFDLCVFCDPTTVLSPAARKLMSALDAPAAEIAMGTKGRLNPL